MPATNRDKQVMLSSPELARLYELLYEQRFTVGQAADAMGYTEADIRRTLNLPGGVELDPATVIAAITVKLNELDNKHRNLGNRQSVTDSRLNRVHRGTTRANAHAARLEKRVDLNEQKLDEIMQLLGGDTRTVGKALEAGRGGGRKSFIQALRQHKYDDPTIRKVIVLLDDVNLDDLTDPDLFAEVFDTLMSHGDRIAETESRLDKHDEILGEDGAHFTRLQTQVQQMTELRNPSPIPGLIVGAIVGIIAGLLWAWHNFDQSVKVNNTTVHVHSLAEDWWMSWLVGLAVGVMVFGLVTVLVSGRSSESNTETVTTTEEETHNDNRSPFQRFRDNRKAKRAERRAQEQEDREFTRHLFDRTHPFPPYPNSDHDTVAHDRQEANAR